MSKSIQEFYNDKETSKNVREFIQQVLHQEAIERVMSKEDVTGIADASEIIDKAFEKMDAMFAPKPKKNSENEAR